MKAILLSLLLIGTLNAEQSEHDKTVIVPVLKGLVFVGASDAIQKGGVAFSGVSLAAVPFLNQPAYAKLFASYLGKPLTFGGLDAITSQVSAIYKNAHHPLVDVVAPVQEVSDGAVQILVTEFRVGEVRVKGNRWFSDSIILAPIKVQHGDTVDTEKLLNEVDYDNTNPFRRVDLTYQPSPQPGYTDLILDTQDRLPITVYSGFDNSGTPVTGRSRWNFGATWGNALWHDQTLSYQLSASDNFFTGSRSGGLTGPSFVSNLINWSMPVRRTDTLSFFGSYQQSTPNVGPDFGYRGKSGQASIRYSVGLPRTKKFVETLQTGYDFKSTNNNLAFGGAMVSRTSAEIDQFPLIYSFNLIDSFGSSSLTNSLFYSPGGLTPTNTSAYFQPGNAQTGIPGASAHYVYFRGDFSRLTKLPSKGVYAFRLLAQTSSANLLYTEKLSAGGPDLLRGYNPNSVYGDHGIVMSNELRTPAIHPWPEEGGEAQFYVFWDYGHLGAAQAFPSAVNSVSSSSVGIGLRYTLLSNVTGHIDYGRALIPLPNSGVGARNSFVDLALTVAY